ncbi:hypothetical protein MAPG_10465 [Magnaporthiopsis poae ATCC 64411]|uniref:Uncharacterized protein n=1 Tax=Magnaporthiopsis poae (strain ATCC 64411 / 73-15) TaxID=644358 RepID=A0A0C4ECN4_MAGP6|nr:hypothetical protein MAPG_10465 [Magnaporthiopsis poae ATCC 64411]
MSINSTTVTNGNGTTNGTTITDEQRRLNYEERAKIQALLERLKERYETRVGICNERVRVYNQLLRDFEQTQVDIAGAMHRFEENNPSETERDRIRTLVDARLREMLANVEEMKVLAEGGKADVEALEVEMEGIIDQLNNVAAALWSDDEDEDGDEGAW